LSLKQYMETERHSLLETEGINQNIRAIYSLYDAELSQAKSFMISVHFRPNNSFWVESSL